MGRTLHRYVFLQVLAPFVAGLALFTFILLIARIMKLVEMVVNRGVPALEILRVFSYILPAFLEVTVPMALLLACLLACGRLSADSEITAMKAAGLSLYQIATPIAVFAVLVFVLSFFLSMYARPWGNSALKSAIFDLARTRATVGLKEHVFNDEFKGLVIYAEEIEPPGNSLLRILISDRRQPGEENTVVAKRGVLVADEDHRSVNLRLFDGVIFTSRASEQGYHKTDFTTYDVSLNLDEALGRFEMREREPSELPLAELRARIASLRAGGEPARAERVEVARRFSIPFAALVFAVIGVPLGLQPVRAVRSRGLAVSLVVILAYYLMLSAAETLGTQGRAPITLALWTPNVVLAAVGVVLFLRQAQELAEPSTGFFARFADAAVGRLATTLRRAG
jgi:lipopolysaccharide export system permease protein